MFVRAANPIWYFVDLSGLQLNDEYYIFFLENTFPYLPQPIYQTPSGTFWSDPIQFFPNGTLPDNMYFNPNLIYRLEIRKGPNQSYPVVYEINNFIPLGSSTPPPVTVYGVTNNQVSNPEFSSINFTSPLTISNTGTNTYNIAPGWSLILVGTGTAVITQKIYSGNNGNLNNPPYALEFNLSGTLSSATLYQQFNGNGALFYSTIGESNAIAMSVGVNSNDGIAHPISLIYSPSTGSPTVITTEPASVGSFGTISGAVTLPVSANSDLSTVAYVQMQIILPPVGDVIISSIQLVSESTPLDVAYQQETPQRQLDQLFHYYYNSLIMLPKDDILTGWNFALNPWQTRSTSLSAASAQAAYYADQTIIVQQNSSGTSINVGQAGYTQNYGLEIQSNNAANQFALIQYVDTETMSPYWGSTVSSLVKGIITTSASTILKFKMRLIYKSGVPASISSTEPITSWAANGEPVFSSAWTAIAPLNDPVYTLGTSVSDYTFNGFKLPVNPGSVSTLGVVLYTINSMSNSPADNVVFNEITLIPNPFALESNPITFNESYIRCQYYYVSTFPFGTVPAQNTGSAGTLAYNAYAASTGGPNSITWNFPTLQRSDASPTVTTYNPNNTNVNWYNLNAAMDSGSPGIAQLSNRNIRITNPQVSTDAQGAVIYIHASVNCRLGR